MIGRRRSAVRGRALLVLVFIFPLIGCGGDPPGEITSVSRDSAGILIIESAAPNWDLGEAWVLPDSPSVEIGVVDGAPEYQLDGVTDALRLPDGRILIVDGGSRELRFYDPDGRWIRSVGGQGRGPGEYESPAGAAVVHDSIWVFDGGLARMSVVDLDGRHVRSFRPDPTGDPRRPLRMYGLAGAMGDSAVLMIPRRWPADILPEPTIYWDGVEILLYGLGGTLLDSIARPRGMEIEVRPGLSGRMGAGDRTFGRVSAAALGDSLLYHSDAARFEIRGYDRADRLRRIIRADIQPGEVSADRWRDIYERRIAGGLPADRAAEFRRYFSEASLPTQEPAHGPRMVAGEDGHLWVQEYVHYWAGETAAWTVFDPDGRWLGTVQPARRPGMTSFEIHQAGPWGVLTVWRDDLGVERVGVWEVDRPT